MALVSSFRDWLSKSLHDLCLLAMAFIPPRYHILFTRKTLIQSASRRFLPIPWWVPAVLIMPNRNAEHHLQEMHRTAVNA